MKKVVVTGATSFIGAHLIKELLDKEAEVYAVIRPGSKNANRVPISDYIHIMELKMDEYDKLPELIDSADCFFHLAWEGARVPYRDDHSMQKKNYECTLKAYEAAKKIRCRFFLGSGSQAEYGSTTGLVDENYPCNPITEYGKQKLNASRELLKKARFDGIKLIWTRIFSLYGPYDYPRTLVMTSIDKMLKDETIEMTEGTQLWDYLYVSDAAAAMVLLSEIDCESGVFNIASGEFKPLRIFVEEIKSVLNSKSDLCFGVIPYDNHGVVNLTPDSSKIKSLGWNPTIGFDTGIRNIVNALKNNTL